MRTIHKVILDAGAPCPQIHKLPFGAKPLHVDIDNKQRQVISRIAVWFEIEGESGAEVEGDPQQVGHRFWIVRDDEEIESGQYIGSLVRESMAWHIYMGSRS